MAPAATAAPSSPSRTTAAASRPRSRPRCSRRSPPVAGAITATRAPASASRSRAASPSATAAPFATSAPRRAARASCYGCPVRSPERVLLVDDDPGFREVYRELLAQDGFTVDEAGHPAEAEQRFARGARLVVLDL